MAKDAAVKDEDYDKAQALKEVCDRLKILGNELLKLEVAKVEAIKGEDFEAAKRIKVEIVRMSKMIEMIDPMNPFQTSLSRVEFDNSLNERVSMPTNDQSHHINIQQSAR